MSLLSDLASNTSVLLFGPPAPVEKDFQPSISLNNPASTSPVSPTSIKEALLRPNLGLDRKPDMIATKTDELPLPPPPKEASATSMLFSTGASAIGLLGSAVLGIASAAVSVLSSTPESVKDGKAEHADEGTMLSSIPLLNRAVSVRDAAISSASSLASTATLAITNATTIDFTSPTPPSPRRATTLPIQYTSTGEPFSSDPSISAMQRIPDHSCTHPQRHSLTHCCSAPDVLSQQCTSTCSTATHDDCECICHLKKSGHFHRVEQFVKGTKRVVRDIKNLL